MADGFTARIEGISSDQWSAATPCTDWTVRDLVGHVIGTNRRVIATLDETEPVEVDLDGDLLKQWLVASGAVLEALGDETRASKTMSGMFGEQPFRSLVSRLVCADTLVHTWDLARATGQDEHMDEYSVAKAAEFLTPIDEGLRRPGGFATKIASPGEADEQTKFLNFCGRLA